MFYSNGTQYAIYTSHTHHNTVHDILVIHVQITNFKRVYQYLLRSLRMSMDPSLGHPHRSDVAGVLPGGVAVYDAHSQSQRVLQLAIVRMVEDTKGLPHVLCNHDIGAYVGMCPFCQVYGFTFQGTRRYPGAVCHLPQNHPLRADFAHEFAHHRVGDGWDDPTDGIYRLASQNAHRMTSALAYQAGARVETEGAEAVHEPFQATSPFCQPDTLGTSYDVLQHTVADLAHGLGNFVKDMYRLLRNNGSMAFTKERILEERAIHRFEDVGL